MKRTLFLAALNPFKLTGNVVVDGLYLGLLAAVVVVGAMFAYYW